MVYVRGEELEEKEGSGRELRRRRIWRIKKRRWRGGGGEDMGKAHLKSSDLFSVNIWTILLRAVRFSELFKML